MRRLWSADGEIIEKASHAKIRWAGGKLDWTSHLKVRDFADLTDRVAQMSDPVTGQPGRMAIVLDGQLESPYRQAEDRWWKCGNRGNFNQREAKMLSDILNNPLKVSLKIGEKYEVSPTLASGHLTAVYKHVWWVHYL